MAQSEFTLIEQLFTGRGPQRTDVKLGIGDDCALLQVPAGRLLAVSLDLFVSGTHFFADADAAAIGRKALAVNLSDLAAQGAEPAWVTLGLTLPDIDRPWLQRFCAGFFELAAEHNVQLVGGDMTRGPLAVCVQAHGLVEPTAALTRRGAAIGDRLFVTGTPGDAGLALIDHNNPLPLSTAARDYLRQRLQQPQPRIAAGLALAGLASSAIDISDGLAQDLGHILRASAVGARLWLERMPLSPALRSLLASDSALVYESVFGGGDDYELCFTVPAGRCAELTRRAASWPFPCSEIGVIENTQGLIIERPDGSRYELEKAGFDHFAS